MELKRRLPLLLLCLFFCPRAEAASVVAGLISTCNAYPGLVRAYGFNNYWRLRESSGTSAAVLDGSNTGTYESSPTLYQPGPLLSSSLSVVFNGSNQYLTSANLLSPSNVFSVAIWFKTTTTSGGKLIGFGSSQTGLSTQYDRHIYMDNSGYLYFGVYSANGVNIVQSTAVYNDGNWHFAVGTFGPDGLNFYVDGAFLGNNNAISTAQSYSGYWRIGGDMDTNWTGMPTSNYFAGTLAEPATSDTVEVTATQVRTLFKIGKTCGQ